jgi:hypothetical protein
MKKQIIKLKEIKGKKIFFLDFFDLIICFLWFLFFMNSRTIYEIIFWIISFLFLFTINVWLFQKSHQLKRISYLAIEAFHTKVKKEDNSFFIVKFIISKKSIEKIKKI